MIAEWRPGRGPGWALLIVVSIVMAAPVAVIVWSITDPSVEVWRELWQTRLPGMIIDTVTLVALVVAGTVIVGTGLAWLVTANEFRGRRLLSWLLVAPIAIPGYVLGFVWLDTLQGPLGARAVRSIWLCAAVLIISLYPYVYVFAWSAFREQSPRTVDVARTLGRSSFTAWWSVVIPMARPSIAAGAALVGMEVLTDVGTVRLFNVSTIADGVLRVWFGTGNRDAATELALLLVVAALGLMMAERALRGRARYTQAGARGGPVARHVTGLRAAVVSIVGWGVLSIAVAVPLVRLGRWASQAQRLGQTQTVSGDLGFHVASSLKVAGIATIACLVIGSTMVFLARERGRWGAALSRLASLGYAVPGPVVAIGVIVTLAAVDRRGWWPGDVLLVGSLVGLVYAMVVRFLAVAHQGIGASIAKVSPNAVASARTLGAGRLRVATQVELPLARAGVIAAATLVAIDSLKELPVTLLLRPFGIEPLPVWVWQATSESLWVQASVPSLMIVAIGMPLVAALLWSVERGAEVAS